MKQDVFARFEKATDVERRRLIWSSFGEPGTGKTTFGLTAPGPIIVQSLDQGLEGVVEPFTKTKDIYVDEYDWTPAADGSLEQDTAIELRDRFIENYRHALKVARTILWDKETDIWALFKYAEWGSGKSPDGTDAIKDWDALKGRLRHLINLSKATDVNFGLIQSLKNEWVSTVNPKTGKKGITQSGLRIRNGMDDVEGLVHLNIEHARVNGQIELHIGKARGPGGRDIQDQTVPGMTFPEFAMLVFPESTEEEWI